MKTIRTANRYVRPECEVIRCDLYRHLLDGETFGEGTGQGSGFVEIGAKEALWEESEEDWEESEDILPYYSPWKE